MSLKIYGSNNSKNVSLDDIERKISQKQILMANKENSAARNAAYYDHDR